MEPNLDTKSNSKDTKPPPSALFKPSVLSVSLTPVISTDPTSLSSSEKANTSSTINPLVSQSAITEALSSKSIGSDYVFGSNISSRVINANVSQGASSTLWTTTSDCGDADVPASSMFTTLAKAVVVTKPANSNGNKNLEDSAKEVAEDKRKEALSLVEVDVFTGEEGERQVVKQHCRAYIFDADKQKWNNLGATQFHLNDIPDQTNECSDVFSRSRVVVRLDSTRRVIINSLIWSEMPLALVDQRSLRIGAISGDGNQIKSYLFVFPPDQSAVEIHNMLRVRKSKATSASTNSVSINSDIASIAGRKRQLEGESDASAQKIPALNSQTTNNVSSALPKTSCTSPSPTSRTNLFRPSVLDSTNTYNTWTNNQETSSSRCIGNEVQFRNSPLDAVVKRLTETTSSMPSESNLSPTPSSTKTSDRIYPSPSLAEGLSVPVPTSIGSRSDFVFGRNISDRVVNTSSANRVGAIPIESDNTNQQTDNDKSDGNDSDEFVDFLTNKHTLEESAAAVLAEMHEKSVYPLVSLPESSIMTGEEGECLTMKVYCQFYVFDRIKQEWIGRGKAYVHLNDIPIQCSPSTGVVDQSAHITSGPPARSRLVIRVCQTLKLLANVPIRSGLNLAMADEHSLRLTTFLYNTNQNIDEKLSNTVQPPDEKVEFSAYLLVMKSNKEAERLYQAILSRLSTFTERQHTKIEQNTDPSQCNDSPSNSCTSKISQPASSPPHTDSDITTSTTATN